MSFVDGGGRDSLETNGAVTEELLVTPMAEGALNAVAAGS